MTDILRYYPTEGRFEYDGRDWRITSDYALKLFNVMVGRIGEWMNGPDLWPVLWPAQLPDYPHNCMWHHMKVLAVALQDTSLQLEPSGGRKASWRLVGKVDVMPDSGVICQACNGTGKVHG